MFKKIALPSLITIMIIITAFLLFDDLETYFTNLLNEITGHPATYILTSFLVLTADIALPVPSSIVMYLNGYALGGACGAALSLISSMVGATIGYHIGSITSTGVKAGTDARSAELITKYGALAVLITRGIPVLSESICVVCGYNKIPLKKYLLYNLAGYAPLCLLYAFCGSLGYNQNTFLISFGCSLLIAAAFWFLGKYYLFQPRQHKTKLTHDNGDSG